MTVQDEQSGEASAAGSSEDEDESEEDAEDSGGSDSHSDLDCEVDSEEESAGPEREQRRRPRERSTGGRQEAQEAAGAELPYTFAGDKLWGFPWFGDGVHLGDQSASRGCLWSGAMVTGGQAWPSSMSLQCCLGAWRRGGLCDMNTDGKRADTHLPVDVSAFGVGTRLQKPGPGLWVPVSHRRGCLCSEATVFSPGHRKGVQLWPAVPSCDCRLFP